VDLIELAAELLMASGNQLRDHESGIRGHWLAVERLRLCFTGCLHVSVPRLICVAKMLCVPEMYMCNLAYSAHTCL
jgi:hypothetical protein